MASTYSGSLRLEKQGIGENSNTWGDLLNTMIDLVDAAIAGLTSFSMASGDVTLTTANGTSDQARNAILVATGVLTANRNIIIPNASKVYLVFNNTSGNYTVTVKTSAGSGVTVTQGKAALVFCDGSGSGTTRVMTAEDASALGGYAAALYGRLAANSSWTAGQGVTAVALSAGATVNTDAALSNVFTLTPDQNFTLANPTNMKDGQTIIWRIANDATPRTITYGSKFKFPNGMDTTLATGASEVTCITGVYFSGADRIEACVTRDHQ